MDEYRAESRRSTSSRRLSGASGTEAKARARQQRSASYGAQDDDDDGDDDDDDDLDRFALHRASDLDAFGSDDDDALLYTDGSNGGGGVVGEESTGEEGGGTSSEAAARHARMQDARREWRAAFEPLTSTEQLAMAVSAGVALALSVLSGWLIIATRGE